MLVVFKSTDNKAAASLECRALSFTMVIRSNEGKGAAKSTSPSYRRKHMEDREVGAESFGRSGADVESGLSRSFECSRTFLCVRGLFQQKIFDMT